MNTRIAYLIPEFPGQTHIFIWRERNALRDLGVETALISTRRPARAAYTHAWGDAASAETTYLAPFGAAGVLRAAVEVLRAGPDAWARCLASATPARGATFKERLKLLAMIPAACKLIRLARAQGCDHVHVHSCGNAANVAMLASRLSRLTYSLTLHGPRLETYGTHQAEKWRHAQFALVVSEQLHASVRNDLAGALPPWVRTAPMGVDLERMRRRSPCASWDGRGPCRIFSCGRLNPVKGHAFLIETIGLLRGRGIDAHLEIAGEDESGGAGYRRVLEADAAARGLAPYVRFAGALPEEAVRDRLEDAHLFALASLDEGVPVAVMEAMAMEMPVVVTDVGGARELIEDGADALLVPPEHPVIMADRIEALLRDPERATRLGTAARKTIAERFDHTRSARELARGLRRLNSPSTSPSSADAENHALPESDLSEV